MSEQEESKSNGGALKYFFWIFVSAIAAGVICFLGILYYTDKNLDKAKNAAVAFVRGFKPNRVITGFHQWCELQVAGNEGGILEVATGEETVEMSRESTLEFFGKRVPLVTASSKIIVPATFRYHIDLRGEWNLTEEGNRLYVVAPPLHPSLPIAFNTEKMQKINPEGWSKYISGSNMAELEKTITPELKTRAMDPENIKHYEAEAKKSIAKFLQSWLIGEEEWAKGKIEEIVVYFDGEVVDPKDKAKIPDLRIEVPGPLL